LHEQLPFYSLVAIPLPLAKESGQGNEFPFYPQKIPWRFYFEFYWSQMSSATLQPVALSSNSVPVRREAQNAGSDEFEQRQKGKSE